MNEINDFLGRKYGMLTILSEGRHTISKNGIHIMMAHCECECGKKANKRFSLIIGGRIKCCGCAINSSIHTVWGMMMDRCYNDNSTSADRYSQRGIKVCEEWKEDFISFYKWASRNGYKKGLTLDRINNNGDYKPSNCRWVDAQTQANNRRSNVYVKINNIEMTLANACRYVGLPNKYKIIHQRMNRDNLQFKEAIIF